ncbi:YtoQ family protein [Hydrocarboniclastica marina]|uniref:YtoQ family protein n=1 Tax=Hydrocarboniclastica marina TaxID=2259620 RepID=A0A4P7XJH9_9ALTE|nr:YtoQ family protein [Hydrocarboniclastica marina]QCF26923.1 YtoQ family protein [Hydrocarboniclastica marina]
MSFYVYLSGEIHTSWRDEIIGGAQEHQLDIIFTSPITDHAASDAAGDMLSADVSSESPFWRDHQSAKVNAIRTQTLIEQADLVVVRFGQEYKQWNAAFDAGYCAALDKPYITLHDDNIIHPLKEVNAGAKARASTTAQVVEILRYVLKA